MFNPSELNRRISARAYDFTKATGGGLIPVLVETIDTWAKIEQLSGSTDTTQSQQQSNAQYRVTIRYRAQINENWLFVYEGLVLKISQLQVDNPAYKRYWIAYCTTTNQLSDWS